MDAFMKMIVNTKPDHKENPFWVIKDNQIYDKRLSQPFSHLDYKDLLKTVLSYFITVYDAFQTECQVLVLRKEDVSKLSHYKIPQIDHSTFSILVLPQENTLVNTHISEHFWHTVIEKHNIVPVCRIHSHHHFDAYQSATDWNSLNSGTLELVLGKIYESDPQVAYWLDERGKSTKNTYYKTTLSASTTTAHTNHSLDEAHDLRYNQIEN